ncbi:MAG: Nramp family divalent metal transporter [Thermoanaerobaculaceae bacterium]|nr:Nramp family divalent metal transporter [Thermoanaerobaculaceae bacterium]MDI9621264.1 Nramp family divalent metal transporter [Acidobacteriota bacterium]HPW54204.1 Nramp family divalent metal transporter [Thermoanaerobaculaceae bacterium]
MTTIARMGLLPPLDSREVFAHRRAVSADGHDPPPPSLGEIRASVAVPKTPSFWRRLFAFIGPAYLVSVGYMDPGNWATDIAAGAKLGYALLWVLLMSNLMAVLLQSLSARLGIVTGMDLAQACRAMFDRRVSWVLWILAEVAIAACDLAEILGSAIGLQLLFGLPLLIGVVVTALDTFLLLFLHSKGVRMMEAFIVVLITTIGVSMAVEVVLAKPLWGEIAGGFVPSLPGEGALFLAIAILGATVMPHNLYLHSALVQSRRISHTPSGIRSGVRFNTIDSVVALNGAFFVNAALLVLAAATFHTAGLYEVADIGQAHRLLEPILGSTVAPIAFAVALIAAGQSSTITGTLAGQIVMEGFVQLRLRPVVRRLATRALALVPAVATIAFAGESSTGFLLVLSQVVLSLQLSFAVVPLVHLVSDRRWMGQYAIKPRTQVVAWVVAGVIVVLNLKLTADSLASFLDGAGAWAWLLWISAVPVAAGLVLVLGYVAVVPVLERLRGRPTPMYLNVHGPSAMPPLAPPKPPRRVAVAVDFSAADGAVLSHAVSLLHGVGRGARVRLLHVVESGGARLMGPDVRDGEARADQARLEMYVDELAEHGVEADFDLGFGEPVGELARLVEEHGSDLVVLGSHGHGGLTDFVLGTTVERLRHRVRVPVLVVPIGGAAG